MAFRWSGRSDGQLRAGRIGAGRDASCYGGEPFVPLGMARSRVSLHGRIGQKQHPVARTVAILEPGGLWHVRAHRRMSRMMSSDSSKSAYITEPRMVGENGSPPGVTTTAKMTIPRMIRRRCFASRS